MSNSFYIPTLPLHEARQAAYELKAYSFDNIKLHVSISLI